MKIQPFDFDMVTVSEKIRETKRIPSKGQYFTEDLGNGIAIEMVEIPTGRFLMGAPQSETEGYDNERPQHAVTVKTFFMSKFPVTQAQWRLIADLPAIDRKLNPDPSKYKGENRPVEKISWHEAVEFCLRLSQETQRKYRLPSEAEWEYACRAGTTTPFHLGKKLPNNLANIYGSTLNKKPCQGSTPVGSFGVANAFGLYDMHGNVYEWCADTWHENYEGAPNNGSVWLEKGEERERVIRGGFWLNYSRNCRSAYRERFKMDERSSIIGFRLACDRNDSHCD